GMVLVDARGGGTNRRAMGREIRQEAGRAGCAPCNAETGGCRVVCRRTIHGWARSDRFGPACCQTLGRTEQMLSSPHAGAHDQPKADPAFSPALDHKRNMTVAYLGRLIADPVETGWGWFQSTFEMPPRIG